MYGIIVRTQFEGIHNYPEAPKEVEYLKYPHRHVFHVEAEIETFDDDRELEFIMVKHAINKFIGENKNMGRISCEQIAKRVQQFLKCNYPTPKQLKDWEGVPEDEQVTTQPARQVNVKVFEDNENGAFIKEF